MGGNGGKVLRWCFIVFYLVFTFGFSWILFYRFNIIAGYIHSMSGNRNYYIGAKVADWAFGGIFDVFV